MFFAFWRIEVEEVENECRSLLCFEGAVPISEQTSFTLCLTRLTAFDLRTHGSPPVTSIAPPWLGVVQVLFQTQSSQGRLPRLQNWTFSCRRFNLFNGLNRISAPNIGKSNACNFWLFLFNSQKITSWQIVHLPLNLTLCWNANRSTRLTGMEM